jgi:hypothetical protein
VVHGGVGVIVLVSDLATTALKASGILGIGQSAQPDDLSTFLDLLRALIGQWQKKRFLVFVEQTVELPASTGALSYSIGPGCDFDVNGRPDRISRAFIRIIQGMPPNLVDIPIEVLDSREDYVAISVKTLETMPATVYYESGFPTGRVYFWPVPPASMYGLFLVVKVPLPTYVSTADPLNLPDEYIDALIWSMCVRMQMAYGLQARPDHVAQAALAINTLRQANAQIPQLAVPAPLRNRGEGFSLVGSGLGRAFILDQGAVL